MNRSRIVGIVFTVWFAGLGIYIWTLHRRLTLGAELSSAIVMGDARHVSEILAQGGDPNFHADGGRTPLVFAARKGDLELVRWLLAHKAEANGKDGGGATALLHAVQRKQSPTVQSLLAAGADTNSADNDGRTPLMEAARNGDIENVDTVLRAGANPSTADHNGRTALMEAVVSGNSTVVNTLLSRKVDANARDADGTTALIEAGMRGKNEIVSILLAYGANAALSSASWRPPAAGSLHTPIMAAANAGHADIMQLLLKQGARLDPKSNDSHVALIRAAAMHYNDVLKLLLRLGVAPRIADTKPPVVMPPVNSHRAPTTTQSMPVSVARSGGVAGMAASPLAESPLLAAASAHNDEAVRLLIAAGSNPNEHDRNGISALNMAVNGKSYDHGRSAICLLESGAVANEIDPVYKTTPLMKAVSSCSPEAVRCLLKHGVNPNELSGPPMNRTVLQAAESIQKSFIQTKNPYLINERAEVIRILKAAGAK